MLNTVDSPEGVLVVDLDGTLLRSDILFETFWASFAHDWRSPFLAAAALTEGRAQFKRYLARAALPDAATLPYDDTVVAYVRDWRAKGGRTALVTASDQSVADLVAGHLGIFDEAHGSDGARNLKGAEKARFLADRFSAGGFTYMGDAMADLPVWGGSRKAITVNAPRRLRDRTDRLGVEVEHLTTLARSYEPYLRALRPHQWLKNLLVFLPMLAAHELKSADFLQSLLAFLTFCLVASSVYVLNDLLDLGADRAHPRKRLRPFASGSIPIAHGGWMALGLILAGAAISVALGASFVLVMAGYYVATMAYSLNLKRRLVIDICVLAGLYTLRIVAGGAATGITLSVWLLAFSIFFFFSLAAIKRQAELADSAGQGRQSVAGRGYHADDLQVISMMAIAAGYVSVLVMALYVNSLAVQELYSYPPALWGVCLVLLYWISRMVMVTHRGAMHDDPVVYAAKDRISQICFLLVVACMAGGAVL